VRSRQCLTNHLAAENLCAANITALPAKYVVINSLKLQELDDVF